MFPVDKKKQSLFAKKDRKFNKSIQNRGHRGIKIPQDHVFGFQTNALHKPKSGVISGYDSSS